MQKTASVRKVLQPMGSQIKAFHDKVKNTDLSETVMNHLKTLNRDEEILRDAGGLSMNYFDQFASSTV